METGEWIWLGAAALAAAGAAYCVLVSGAAGARESRVRAARALSALLLAGGFVCIAISQLGLPESGWVHHATWCAMAAGILAGLIGLGRRARARIVPAVLLASAIVAISFPAIRREWEGGLAAPVAAVLLGLLGAAVLASTAVLASRRPGPTWPAALILVAVGVAALVLLSHYATYAILAGGLAAVATLAAAVTIWRPSYLFGPAASVALVSCAAALLLGAYLQTLAQDRAPATSFLLVGVAPLVPWAAELPALKSSPRRAALLRLGAVVLTIAIALALAHFGASAGDQTPVEGFDFDDF